MIHRIKTIDAHVGGQPLRLVVDGLPRPVGKTIARKRDWLRRHADRILRAIVMEPRGHADMTAAMLLEPEVPGAHAGLVFMDADGFTAMSGHGVIAAATIAIERELFFSRDDDTAAIALVFDTVAGAVHTRARLDTRAGVRRVGSVAATNVPAFVHTASHPVQLGGRTLRVDIAFGGAFYAIVDSEAIGIPLSSSRIADLRRLGVDIQTALAAVSQMTHPSNPGLSGIAGVIFTGPPQDPQAHLRNVTVSGGVVDRSPSGTGTSAVMAVLDAMGLLPEDQAFVHESVTGALFRGRVVARTVVGELPALVPEIEGSAWITGEHAFAIDDDDPFAYGFSL